MGALQSLSASVQGVLSGIRGGRSSVLAEPEPLWGRGWSLPTATLDLVSKRVTYGALYRSQPSVATVVDKRANATARLSLRVWDTTPATGKRLDTTSPLARLISNPCPDMSPFAFWRWVSSTYDIYGEAFLLKIRNGAAVTALVPVAPTTVTVERDDQGVVKYRVMIGGVAVTFPSEDVIALTRYNPDSILRGVSRLEPLRSTLAAEDAARRAQLSFWQNGARPATVLKHPLSLTSAAAQRVKATFDALHAGPDRTGGTVVIDEGMDVVKMQLDLEEMQYVESRKLAMSEVCMVFDVPPPVVHILDHATFSNISEQMRSMYRDTMAPHLEDIESCLMTWLAPDFATSGVDIKFALDEVLRGDVESRADTAVKLVTNGLATPNELRSWFDLDEFGDVADRLYANQAMQPLSTPVAGSAPVDAPAPPPADPAPVVLSRDARTMAGRIRAKSTSSDVEAEAVRVLAKALRSSLVEQRDAIRGAAASLTEPTAADVYAADDWRDDVAAVIATPMAAVHDVLGGDLDGADLVTKHIAGDPAAFAASDDASEDMARLIVSTLLEET